MCIHPLRAKQPQNHLVTRIIVLILEPEWSGLLSKIQPILPWRRSFWTKGSRSSSNCFRRLKKLVLPSIFDTSLSSFMMWNLQSYSATVLNERMRHFRGSKHTLTPPTYFRGSGPLAPWSTPMNSSLSYWLGTFNRNPSTTSSVIMLTQQYTYTNIRKFFGGGNRTDTSTL